jgi:hypothetical protein
MKYNVMITIADAEDAFEVARLLAPIAKEPKVKVAAIIPRPDAPPTPVTQPGRTLGALPTAMG